MKPSKNLTITRRKAAKVVGASGAVGVLGLSLGSIAPSCLNRPIDVLDTRTTSTVVEQLHQNGVDKIDLLLAIDNSISMGDKQQILAAAVPDLVNRLVTPNCVDENKNPTGQTVDAAGECPDNSAPEFPPIRNINVGIISSSLGDLTSDACSTVADPNDKAHLLSRASGGGEVGTFEGKGFLAWDPDNKRGGETNAGNLSSDLAEMVRGVNQIGCGYEMQLESVLRFLVDPAPYDQLVRNDGNKLDKVGVDEALLAQRKDFLRPDSLLAILLLSDENDCSVDVTGQGFLLLEPGPFYRATSACKDDPTSDCCTSCALNDDPACDPDNECSAGPNGGKKYSDTEDPANLACYNQKERYGVNFLYPVKRYVNAFTQPKINPGARDYSVSDAADAVANPIFSDLQGTNQGIRSPDLVFVAGIVGVPWQAIARKNESGEPDLSLGFQTFNELQGDLAALVGDPDKSVYPTDPFMVESVGKRSGTSAIMGVSIDGPGAPNGGEYTVDNNLQFACIFPLVTPNPTGSDCADCAGAECDNPLCDGTTQVNAKAYPGLRELSLLEGMGTQGIFGSICPAEVNNTNSPIYGYRPAVDTIIRRLGEELGGQCLPRKLTPDPDTGRVQCLVIEASATGGGACCEAAGRLPIPEQVDGAPNPKYAAVTAAKEGEFANENWDCFCELEQLVGEELTTCQENTDPQAGAQGDGWCYIDGTEVPPVGNPELVQNCPADERRLVRFVGDGDPITGATVFVTCSGE